VVYFFLLQHHDSDLVSPRIRHGCAVVNGICLGKGERTGNAALELILLRFIGTGYYASCQPDFTVLNELREELDSECALLRPLNS
jgi:isopropylmalate/homocitrate/citramalate synthase